MSDIKKIVEELIEDPYNYANGISVKDLVEILRQLAHHYYNTNVSLVPDEIYDLLREILEERDAENPYLVEVGAPVNKNKVKLPYYMPSLNKIKPDTGVLEKFIKKYDGPYVLSDKLDGVSGLYVYNKNKSKLYTRGDIEVGQDISHLIPYVISKNVRFDKLKIGTAIRGELIISKSNFKKISDKFKNARNTVAGLVNSKNFSIEVAKLTEFIAYSIIHPVTKQSDQFELLESINFPLVTHKFKKLLDNDMLSKYMVDRRTSGEYDIDGIVVIDDSDVYEVKNKNPEYGFAFKKVLTDQVAEVTVLDVEWNVSKDGYLKPRVRIEPTKLAGVEIRYMTAHNAKYVEDNVIGPGAIIELVRSGDVIPYIKKVLKKAPSGKAKMPTIPYKWNESKVDLIVKDIHGAASSNIKIKKITYFFKKLNILVRV